jgi:hypothetical protein
LSEAQLDYKEKHQADNLFIKDSSKSPGAPAQPFGLSQRQARLAPAHLCYYASMDRDEIKEIAEEINTLSGHEKQEFFEALVGGLDRQSLACLENALGVII